MRLISIAVINLLANVLTLFVLLYYGVRHLKNVNNFINENTCIKEDVKSLVRKVSNIERVILKHDE